MLRTDHCYPPTVHAPLYPTVADHHFEAITMPAPLPPVVEPLAPSPRRTTYEATLPATLLQELPRRAPPAWTPPPPDGGPAHAMSVRTAVALEVLKTRLAGMSHVPCENLPIDSLARFAYRMADAAIAAQGAKT